MGARKQINRYKTEPFGGDFDEVVKRAKAFYKDGTFGVWLYGDTWNTYRVNGISKDPDGAIIYQYKKGANRGKWERIAN